LHWLGNALSSSVGKKFVMGITGLLLCGFLVVHLAGNLLLYVGPEAYNRYAHTLHSQEWLIKIAEVILLLLFASHIFLGIRTMLTNRAARRKEYAVKESKIRERTVAEWLQPESWMFISGAIVLGFLLLHLSDFHWQIRLSDQTAGLEPFEKALTILSNPISMTLYIIGCLVLGVHLLHGFSSAFQSLGINHPKYTPWIKCLGIVFAFVIGLGFASFPVWAALLRASQ